MRFSILLFFAFIFFSAQAQTDKTQALARQYYQNGDYEKSASLFDELWRQYPENYYYYNSLFNSLVRINDYKELESVVKKQLRKFKNDSRYQVDLGYVYSLNNQPEKAKKEYQIAIDQLSDNEQAIRNLAYKFIGYRQDEFAILTYEKGNQLFKDNGRFAFELGNAYVNINQAEKAISNWLSLIDGTPQKSQRVQSILSANINKDNVQDELETQLYQAIQKNNNKDSYTELLIWLFTQQKDFESALIQAKALDKRNKETGERVMQLSYNAVQEELYDAAIDGYNYVIEKGEDNRLFIKAKAELLNARKLKVVNTPNYTKEDIQALKLAYESYLTKYGTNMANANVVRDLANLEANYTHELDIAINHLEDLLKLPNLTKRIKNETKLELGDYYMLKGDVWESTLLYAQVDKDEKDSPLGEDARFRNARLSYFKGEFEWAQAQLSILKGATTELIANDALDLSVFIMDNMGLDTSTTAMEMYAKASLYSSQNKPSASLEVLDSILTVFPDHMLEDNVLFEKANIYMKERNYEKAITQLNTLLTNHGEDILADDAAFMAAEIYHYYLDDTEQAMGFYKQVITEYSESVLVVEARKRYRALRGDGA